MIFSIRILVVMLAISCMACSTKPEAVRHVGYTVDSTIMQEVTQKLSAYNKTANTWVSYTIYTGDSILFSTADSSLPGLAFTSFSDSAWGINASTGIEAGEGFAIVFNKDTTIVQFYIHSFMGAFASEVVNMDELIPELHVPCKWSKVVLSKKTEGKQGEIIAGKIELESMPFYALTDTLEKMHCKMTAYFMSEPMPINNKQYKTLNPPAKQ